MTTMKEEIKVLLVDDHSLIRYGLRSAISHNEDYMIFECDEGKKAIAMAEKLHPDIIVLDISLPDINGMEVAKSILTKLEDTKIIILSMYDDEEYISTCLGLGVHGYILKNEGEEIEDALKTVLNGRKYYSHGIRDFIVDRYASNQQTKIKPKTSFDLTRREKEIVRYLIKGMTSQQIADKLFISSRTIDTHRANIKKKLKTQNLVQLIAKVQEFNLLD